MNNLDLQNADYAYLSVLDQVLRFGKDKGDRTGTGTKSIFHHTMQIDMSEGFPLITTKKVFTNGIIHELLWFLNGDTNIKYLVDNGVNIWNADAYREFINNPSKGYRNIAEFHQSSAGQLLICPTVDDFANKIKEDEDFANRWGELGPIYGKQWVNWSNPVVCEPEGWYEKGVNQIKNAIETLRTNPDSRRIMVSAWNVSEVNQMALPPCHWAFELYTEELTLQERVELLGDIQTNNNGYYENSYAKLKCDESNIPKRRLHLKWHQRSVDTFLGLPFNIASYGLLLHMFAQQANMVVGRLVGDLTNVHIYNNHIEQCKEQLTRKPKELPILELKGAKDMFSYRIEDFNFVGYSPHPAIKGEISA